MPCCWESSESQALLGPNESQEFEDDITDDTEDKVSCSKRTVIGYVCAIFGILSFTIGLACTQALDQSIPHAELNALRYFAQFLLICPVLLYENKCDPRFDKGSTIWVLIGSIVVTVTGFTSYGAVYYLPLGVVCGLTKSICLVFNCIINCITERKIKWTEVIAAILCITGVVMVIQPPLLFHNYNDIGKFDPQVFNGIFQSPCRREVNGTSLYSDKHKQVMIGYILCVVDAAASAIHIQVVNRKLKDLKFSVYNFWASMFGCVVSAIIMGASETPYLPTVAICIMFLVVHIITAGGHNIFLIKAYQILSPVVASLIVTLMIPLTFILQYTALSGLYPGHMNALEIVGAVLVFLGNVFVSFFALLKTLRSRQKSLK